MHFSIFPLVFTSISLATGSHLASRGPHAGVGVKKACEQLRADFPEITLFPNSTGYAAEIINVWDKRCNLVPACVFRAQTAGDVAAVLRIVKQNNAQFAVRGGGHMNYPGSNNINDGILVTVNSLNQTTIANDKKSIDVGPGARWVDVYRALAPDGLYTIGGRLKSIGVPGLTLLGGVSYFLNKYGFAADNVISYDVVLANGTQVTANAVNHTDLFWALKGSASNYGIVTNFQLKTFNIPEVSCTYQVYDEPAIEEFIRATVDLVANDDGAIGAGGVFNINYNTTTKRSHATVIGMEESSISPPPRLSKFTAIPDNVTLTRIFNVSKPIDWHNQFETPNQMFRIAFGHHTIFPDAEQLIFIYHAWRDAIKEIEDVEGLLPTFVLNLVAKSAATVAKNNGIGNTFGLDDSTPTIWWQFATSWARAEDDLRVQTWNRNLLQYFHRLNKDKGLATEFIYGGDASEDQNPLDTYPSENIAKMKRIRDVYDPDLVWTKLNWGGYKLGF